MNTSKNKLKSLMLVLFFSAATISTASARVCFLPDSTDCGEGDVVGNGNVDVPCQYSSCPAYNTNYQECYDERTYNNGGVNVTCKQIKCKLSKSECEKQEADPNSSQCCNFDRDSGCYYMGSCKLCNRDVFDSEKNLGEGYDCYPCKDKNGTFYNCTAKEKECNQINSNYTSSCGDSQIAKEVEGIKDSHGNQCYTCKDKPIGCTYEYRQATTNDSCGRSEVIGSDDSCVYALLSMVKSVYFIGQSRDYKSGSSTLKSYLVNVAINRISNTSATCVDENKVTKYQTICEGTPESLCKNEGDEFIPNGCVSDTYNNGFEVKGDKWGTCKKANICKYEFTQLTTLDTHSISKFNPNDINAYDYNKVRDLYGRFQSKSIKSALYYVIDEKDYHLFNKISKDSKTCYDDNHQLRYETICTDPSKQYCDSKKGRIFTHTCTSEEYNVIKLKMESMEFGTCVCDLSKQLYETNDDCMKANEGQSLRCTRRDSDWCYQTCEDAGMYSSEDACKTNAPKYTKCNFNGSCYIRSKPGWGFHYEHGKEDSDRRRYICTPYSFEKLTTEYYSPWTASVYVEKSRNEHFINWEYAKDLIGDTYPRIEDQKGEVRYPAGKYRICVNTDLGVASFYIAKTNGDACRYYRESGIWHADKNNKEFCSDMDYTGGNSKCLVATFEDYMEYYVMAHLISIDGYSCQPVKGGY